MSAAHPYIALGLDQQGRIDPRCTAYPDTEPGQLAPAECRTDIGCDDDGPWESADRECLVWLSHVALKIAAVLGLTLVAVQAWVVMGVMWGAP